MGADKHTPLLTEDGFDILSLVRPNVLSLQPYRSARDDYDSGVLLDANENAYGPATDPALTDSFVTELERYPDPMNMPLKRLIAAKRGVQAENVFLGNGSDEGVDLTMRVFVPPGQGSILINPPTYGMYSVMANANGLKIVSVPLTADFQLQPALIKAAADQNDCRVIFLCTPNNPTANDLIVEDIVEVIRNNPHRIVVVDEAYIDFSEMPSFAPQVNKYPNLVVVQTMSKAFGLAGVRLGMLYAAAPIIEVYNRIKAPYSIGKPAVAIGMSAWQDAGFARMKEHVRLLNEQRGRLATLLKEIPEVQKIFPATANFLMVRVPNAYAVYKRMADLGVVTRYRGMEPGCENCIRITIGKGDDIDKLIAVFKQALAEQPSA